MISIIIILLVIVLCFYLGVLYTNPMMLVIGYAQGILLVVSFIELLYRLFTVRCHVSVPISMVEQGKPVKVLVQMKNNGLLPAGKAEVRIVHRNVYQKKGKGRWLTIYDVPMGECKTHTQLTLHGAGCHEIELTHMRIHGLFGLVSIKRKCKDFSSVLIMPEIHAANMNITEVTRNFMGDADVYDDFRPGHDTGETFEIREYREKDKLQSIHWKLSAKTDTLMVRESSLPKACGIVLMLDLHPWKLSTNALLRRRVFHKEEMDVGAYFELAATISYCLMDQKCPHFVAWYSKEKEGIRRIRVDDEESFYLFLDCYLREAVPNEKKVRDEYRKAYKNEWYLHDICINEQLEIYKNGEFVTQLGKKNIKDECERLELLF